MNELTFFEKIQVLFKLLFSSPIIIGIFAFSLVLMISLFFSSKLNRKFIKYVFIGVYLLIIGFTIFKYGSYFLTSIDSFFTLFMANIYFPIIPIYVVIMIISFIIMIVTLSGNKKSLLFKIINILFFSVIQMLFVIFIYVVESNNIDLSSNTNLYTNEQTLTLLEFGVGLFLIWIVLLLIIFYFKKADKIFKSKKSVETDDFDEYINDYNVPTNDVKANSFNSNIVQTLVPETSMYDTEEEILSFDDSSSNVSTFVPPMNSNNLSIGNQTSVASSSSSLDVFNGFDFLDTNVVRKNDDVEIIDID